MRKTLAAIAAAGSLLAGIAIATPALAQARPITLLCSPSTNGGTLVNGVCVLPAAAVGQPYEGFLLNQQRRRRHLHDHQGRRAAGPVDARDLRSGRDHSRRHSHHEGHLYLDRPRH